jgi:hypothetical protein
VNVIKTTPQQPERGNHHMKMLKSVHKNKNENYCGEGSSSFPFSHSLSVVNE